jgi:hypothetical protein
MPVTLVSIDAVPITDDDQIERQLKMWLRDLSDVLNTNIQLIQTELTDIDARLSAGGL